MNSRGITLIELLVVVSIIAILAIALGFSYVGWQGAYKVERQIKDLYADLMDIRGRAISQNREFFADFNIPAPAAGQGSYRLILDANGNLINDDAALPTFPKSTEYAITWSGVNPILFDRRGIIRWDRDGDGSEETLDVICLTTTAAPDYDCIRVTRTRINLGLLTTQISNGGVCGAANCVAK